MEFDTDGIIGLINKAIEYAQLGLDSFRSMLSNWIGGEMLFLTMLGISFFAGYILVKRFVMKPFSLAYIIQTIIVSFLFFLVLMYV